jgi:hypothetical protein
MSSSLIAIFPVSNAAFSSSRSNSAIHQSSPYRGAGGAHLLEIRNIGQRLLHYRQLRPQISGPM